MPAGNVLVVVIVGGKPVIVRVNVCSEYKPSFPVTRTRKLAGPLVVGVPVIAPDDGSNDKPAGIPPDVSDQVYGVDPPLAANAVL